MGNERQASKRRLRTEPGRLLAVHHRHDSRELRVIVSARPDGRPSVVRLQVWARGIDGETWFATGRLAVGADELAGLLAALRVAAKELPPPSSPAAFKFYNQHPVCVPGEINEEVHAEL